MAETTPYAKLRVDDALTTDARYNLYRIDTLFSSGLFDSSGNLTLRSATDITFRPGNGVGGSVVCNHKLTNFSINSTTLTLNDDITFSGTWTLPWANISTVGASVNDFSDFDTEVDTNASVVANTAHAANISNPHSTTAAQVGAYTIAQTDAAIATHAALTISHGVSSALVGVSDTQIISNKTINAPDNTLTNISNSNISATAAIAGTKISPDFGGQVINTSNGVTLEASGFKVKLRPAPVGMTANVDFKLPSADGTPGQVLITDGSGQLSFITSAASSLLLANNIRVGDVTNTQAVVDTNATGEVLVDSVTGLTLKTNIIDDTHVDAGAAIALTKLAAMTTDRVLVSDNLGFITPSGTTTTEIGFVAGVTSAIQTQIDAKQDILTGATSALTNFNLPISRALISSPTGKVIDSPVTSAELGHLAGVTSAVQTQIDSKEATITGAATTITATDLTLNRVVISNGSGKIAASAVTDTELGFVSGVSSAIQTQIDSKQATITGAATTVTATDLTINRALLSDGAGKIAVSSVTNTELGYVSGVTSAIQTQINGKENDLGTPAGDGYVLVSTTGNVRSWAAPSAIGFQDPTTTQGDLIYNNGTITTRLPIGGANTVLKSNGTTVSYGTIVNADIDATAAIAFSKLSALTTDRALVSNGSGEISASLVTATEIGYLDGVTSNIQTQLDAIPAGSIFKTDWTNAQGATKVVTHSLGTQDVMVELYDTVTFETLFVDSVVRTDTNTVTLTASAAPTNTIRVLIKEI